MFHYVWLVIGIKIYVSMFIGWKTEAGSQVNILEYYRNFGSSFVLYTKQPSSFCYFTILESKIYLLNLLIVQVS